MSECQADALIDRLTSRAATAARAVGEARTDWERSQANYHADYDARYAIQQERGHRLALAHAIAALQPASALPPAHQYRTADGGVDVDGYYRWLHTLCETAKEAADSQTADHGARGAALGYGRLLYELETDDAIPTDIDPPTQPLSLASVPTWPTEETR